jgi:hypothetical protein
MIVFVVVLLLVINQDNDIRSIIKDKKIFEEIKDEKTKDTPEFYLHADVEGEYSFMGTPFLDSRCTTESDNLIIYGHNIRGGRMFGLLHGYRKTEYYKEHLKSPKIAWVSKKNFN